MRRHLAAGAPAVVVGERTQRRWASFGGARRRSRSSCRAASSAWLDAGSRDAAGHGRAPGGRARRARLRGRRARPRRLARAAARAARPGRGRRRRRPRRRPGAGRCGSAARWSSTSGSSPRRSRWPIAGRVDLVTARSERYERPGALPRVLPGADRPGSRRRDFTVNAMAVELGSGAFGLLDPLGGGADVGAAAAAHPAPAVVRGGPHADLPRRALRRPPGLHARRAGARAPRRWRCRWRRIPRCRRRGSWPSWSGSSPTPSPPPR